MTNNIRKIRLPKDWSGIQVMHLIKWVKHSSSAYLNKILHIGGDGRNALKLFKSKTKEHFTL